MSRYRKLSRGDDPTELEVADWRRRAWALDCDEYIRRSCLVVFDRLHQNEEEWRFGTVSMHYAGISLPTFPGGKGWTIQIKLQKCLAEVKNYNLFDVSRMNDSKETLAWVTVKNLGVNSSYDAGSYEDYLDSEHWHSVKQAAKDRARGKCQLCGSSNVELHVHHNSYDRVGSERFSDVVVLCSTCHDEFHSKLEVADE